ncbi:hypothetical protein TD95_000868 [Thielaviopsis punctulata]|uniref:Uncharacterized protein n=1 Tax=Thielaviopsis punctulata TaxID=72032 RepID=A0A0F4Z8D0_9PEZI|nr:hypothetical protein TD95_000868 [Thielaviopsis punctulata]
MACTGVYLSEISTALAQFEKLTSLVERTEAMLLAREDIPDEAAVSAALKACLTVAKSLTQQAVEIKKQESKSLLDVDEKPRPNKSRPSSTALLFKKTVDRVSEAAFKILKAPNVTITTPLIQQYIKIQGELAQADTIPEILYLYGTKPYPVKSGSGIRYKKRFSSLPYTAIDEETAASALKVAISTKNLDAAINIVDVCYCTRAFYLRKISNSATLPLIFASVVPATAYGLAQAFAKYNSTIDPATATSLAFVGIMGYIGFTGTMGVVARMSMMDHMKRVTWFPGTPFRQRWLREEERAAMDKIAMAWGFQETWKHGEETGVEWENLKEYLGHKQMLLDRVEFMEGMN